METQTSQPFKCNRDKWLEGSEALDCPSLLVGFLRVSVLDFVMYNLLSIFLLLCMYPP